MRRRFAPALGALTLALAGCQGETSGSRASDPPQASPAADGPSPASSSPFSSDYTHFDLAACTVTKQWEEGASASYRCPGRDGVPLLVGQGDGRFTLDAGVENDESFTVSAFNSIGDTIEWRLREGRPVAVIFRYRDETGQAPGRTVLAVEKIGKPGAPGCRIAQIAGDTPDANRLAREIADDADANFTCGTDEVRYIGSAR